MRWAKTESTNWTGRIAAVLGILLVLVLIALGVYGSTISPDRNPVEVAIPNDRFAK